MSASANVKAIEALEALRQSLMRFHHDASNAMNAATLEIKRTLDWLQERLRFWQHEIYRRDQTLQAATRVLQACLSSRRYDAETGRVSVPDCSYEQMAVMEAQRQVQEAKQELRTIQEQMSRIEEAIKSYQLQANRLAGKLNDELQKGSLLLERSSSILYSYVSGRNVSANGTNTVPTGSKPYVGVFSISDWTGYPSSAAKPSGPFILLQGEAYNTAREQANATIRLYRYFHANETEHKQVHHIHPVKFGGDPDDLANLQILSAEDHQAITIWWNKLQRKLSSGGGIS